jgi:hypothetical protein
MIYVNRYTSLIISIILISCKGTVNVAAWEINSPDNNILARIELADGKLYYSLVSDGVQVLDTSALGVVRSDTDLSRGLTFVEKTELIEFSEHISFQTGKQLEMEVRGKHQILTFQNPQHKRLQLEMKIFNDGFALRNLFPDQSDQPVTIIRDEMSFAVPVDSRCWLQPYDEVTPYTPAYEKYFENGISSGASGSFGNGWCMPALFNINQQWLLISESGIDGDYAGSHLDNQQGSGVYTLRWPEKDEAKGIGEAAPSSTLPWNTSWKTLAIGDLEDIIKSDLVKQVSPASRIDDTSWILPGRASWSWLSDHTSPRDFNKLKPFIDLASDMGWEYSLVDANWDQMEGGDIEQLVQYANSKGVGILTWYNSGGPHNDVTEAPRNKLNDPVGRKQEFEKLRELGVKGIKVDFFQSDKQFMMELYKQILEDAAEFQIMVNFHGCAIPL